MVDQATVIARRSIALKLFGLVLIIIAIANTLQVEALAGFQQISLEIKFYSAVTMFAGLILIIEGLRNLPVAKDHFGAKTGAYIFLVLGVITIIFGTSIMMSFVDVDNLGQWGFLYDGLLGFAGLMLFIAVLPEIINGKLIAHQLRNS